MAEYTIVEGGSGVLEVCINVIGELERSATIILNTSDATAVGKTSGPIMIAAGHVICARNWHNIPT